MGRCKSTGVDAVGNTHSPTRSIPPQLDMQVWMLCGTHIPQRAHTRKLCRPDTWPPFPTTSPHIHTSTPGHEAAAHAARPPWHSLGACTAAAARPQRRRRPLRRGHAAPRLRRHARAHRASTAAMTARMPAARKDGRVRLGGQGGQGGLRQRGCMFLAGCALGTRLELAPRSYLIL
eukprot:319242-Chlamydomonas_euryale.AAC.2